jgi:hypothetical protein
MPASTGGCTVIRGAKASDAGSIPVTLIDSP